MKKHKGNRENKEKGGGNLIVLEKEAPKSMEIFKTIDINEKLDPKDLNINTVISEDDDPKVEHMPELEIPRFVFYKMMAYAKLVNEEISGLGYIEKITPLKFKMTDVFLIKQEVTGASCKFDVDDDCRLMQELIDKGKDPSKLKLWWHSHVNMGTGWSGTDENTSKISACDYFFSIVVCHDMTLRCKMNIYQPAEVEIDNIKVIMVDNESIGAMLEDIKEEVKRKVFKKDSISAIIAPGQSEFNMMNSGENFNRIPITDDDAPYGSLFVTGEYTFKWNRLSMQYDVYETRTGVQLKTEEIERLGLGEYAFPPSDLY